MRSTSSSSGSAPNIIHNNLQNIRNSRPLSSHSSSRNSEGSLLGKNESKQTNNYNDSNTENYYLVIFFLNKNIKRLKKTF